MCEDRGTVLVVGGRPARVARVTDLLVRTHPVRTLPVRTFVTTEGEGDLPSDVTVAVFADWQATDHPTLERLPDDCAHVGVFREIAMTDGDRPAPFDRLLLEPVVVDDLQSTVASLSRRVRYDRRLRECAKLAARCGRDGPEASDDHASDSSAVCEEIADAKAEIDGLVAEFSNDDFRQAFQTLAAD